MEGFTAGYPDKVFELVGDVSWRSPADFEIEDNSEYEESDYHYSVKVGTYTETDADGAVYRSRDVYCNVSGYYDGNDEPQIYSDDEGKAFFEYTMIDMPDGMLQQVFDTVKPQLEKTRAEFEQRAAEREGSFIAE